MGSPPRGRGRPLGALGATGAALVEAVRCGGPAEVRVLADRAGVGLSVARRRASALVSLGQLVPLNTGRPAVLALPGQVPAGGAPIDRALAQLVRVFWSGPPVAVIDDECEAD